MPIDVLIQEAKGMTDDALMEVIHFMQYLKIAPVRKSYFGITPADQTKGTIYRVPGIYKNKIKIAEGFDNPFDDFKYM